MRLIICFFLLSCCNLFGQSNSRVSGNVKSNEGLNMAGVTVVLDANNNNTYVATDSLGVFSTELKTGLVRVLINHFGYTEKKLSFSLKKDTILSVVLDKSISILKEVVVSNNKKSSVSSLSGGKLSFNLKELSSLPTILGTTDIIKLLQLTPGVQNSGDANGYLYVRGGDPGHNSILYSGTPIYGMSHLAGIFPFYNADHIEEVEFDKSSSNAKYGGRLSSTTLLIPKKKIPSKFAVQGNLGLLASQITLAVPIGKKTGFYISGRKTYVDEIIIPLLNSFSESNDIQDMKYRFSDCNLTFITEISKNNSLTVDAFMSGDKLMIKDDDLALKTNLQWGNFTFSPTLNTRLSAKTSMSNSIYYTKYNNNLDLKQATIQMTVSSHVQDLGFTNSFRFFVKEVPFESGLQYIFHNLQPQKIQIEGLNINSKKNNFIKANEFGVFATAKPKFSDFLNTELGLRVNYYNSGSKSNSYLKLEPRMILNYYPNKNFSFYTSYNRQSQFLSLITSSSVGIPTDFWIASTEGIAPQTSDEFTIGSNQIISKNITTSLGGFYRSMRNLLEYPYGVTQFNEVTTLKNDLLVGNGTAFGLETMLQKNNGKFRGWLSYTLSWSNRDFEAINNGNSYFAKYDRRHNLSLVGMYDLNLKWNFGITQILSSGNRFTMPTSWYFTNNNPVKEYSEFNNAQTPNYIRTDLSVNYFFIKSVNKESTLNFSIYNTFNIENPIYVVLNVKVNENKKSVVVETEKKYLYQILPSISWRFKF